MDYKRRLLFDSVSRASSILSQTKKSRKCTRKTKKEKKTKRREAENASTERSSQKERRGEGELPIYRERWRRGRKRERRREER